VIVLDTNVLSELMRSAPHPRVLAWLAARSTLSLYTTSVTAAEILHGILMLPKGRKRQAFEEAATAMFQEDFRGRVLGFGPEAAMPYATIASDRRRAGRPISQFDAQIAAIARSVGATVATRNTTDFDGCGVDLVNPWTA
jgi:predicted nucleic acid-binding protein